MKMSIVIILLLFTCLIATNGASGTKCSGSPECVKFCRTKGCRNGKCMNRSCKCYLCS
uniref:Potassium channel toxin alpha-KTx 23.3 n=1 Tax=Scorpiops tibetanus TaxID=500600 RepID=KA233_SCOTI|nr:RecName: Full=Potassium channel toxin alpha-KTx 23.3; AltName: Full=Toxin St20; Flags: Precursor [Scorpiops tibetanus]